MALYAESYQCNECHYLPYLKERMDALKIKLRKAFELKRRLHAKATNPPFRYKPIPQKYKHEN